MKPLFLTIALGLSFGVFAAPTATYFSPLDIQALHDEEVMNERKGEAPRFAISQAVSIGPSKFVNWEKSANGDLVWSHRIQAPNAVSLNFGFTQFYLPEGAKLNIYSSDHSQFIRTFTSDDNNLHNELWTPIIMSDDVVIELTVSEAAVNDVQLELSHVGQGFREFSEPTKDSGACNVDVACSESKGWEDEVNSVGVISTGGSTFCTGFMVNNTKNDGTPFFMTAAHCRINARNAATLVVYWNYQSSSCGGSRDGKLTDFQTGSVHLASGNKSDFTLVKLLKKPDSLWNVKYAGWDATGEAPLSAVGIHHPNTDEKAISFENDPTAITSYLGKDSPGDSTHVQVVDWDKGTTEPGSSGSPLFDANHRVIGQLHGGHAACGNEEADYYGRLHTSWLGDGTTTGSLKQHLDPDNSGHLTVDTLSL